MNSLAQQNNNASFSKYVEIEKLSFVIQLPTEGSQLMKQPNFRGAIKKNNDFLKIINDEFLSGFLNFYLSLFQFIKSINHLQQQDNDLLLDIFKKSVDKNLTSKEYSSFQIIDSNQYLTVLYKFGEKSILESISSLKIFEIMEKKLMDYYDNLNKITLDSHNMKEITNNLHQLSSNILFCFDKLRKLFENSLELEKRRLINDKNTSNINDYLNYIAAICGWEKKDKFDDNSYFIELLVTLNVIITNLKNSFNYEILKLSMNNNTQLDNYKKHLNNCKEFMLLFLKFIKDAKKQEKVNLEELKNNYINTQNFNKEVPLLIVFGMILSGLYSFNKKESEETKNIHIITN